MNLFVVTGAHALRHPDQRGPNRIAVLRLVPNAKDAHATAQVAKLAFSALVERDLNGHALLRVQLSKRDEIVQRLLDQPLQVTGSQVE